MRKVLLAVLLLVCVAGCTCPKYAILVKDYDRLVTWNEDVVEPIIESHPTLRDVDKAKFKSHVEQSRKIADKAKEGVKDE